MITTLKFLPAFFLITILLLSCTEPEEIISPTHYSRVPRPQNLSATVDTTDSGTKRVSISWTVPTTENLRNFELYRAKNINISFASRVITEELSFVDTNFVAADSVAFYFVLPNGVDRFVGQASDTLRVSLNQ